MEKRLIHIGFANIQAAEAKAIKREFNRLKRQNSREITLRFRGCRGGNTEAVLDLIDYLLTSGVPIRTRNIGWTYSAASILFLAGDEDKREGTPASRITLHSTVVTTGKVRWNHFDEDHARLKAYSKRIFIRAMQFVKSRTRLTMEEVEMFFSRDDLYFDLEAARKFGLVTARSRKSS